MTGFSKLKPPHGWSVVACDLAIVTLGVLIALVVQQWADERNTDSRTREALAGIKDELSTHYIQSVEWRVVEPCIVAQIDSLTSRVLHSRERLDPAPIGSEGDNFHYVIRMPSKAYPRASWDAGTNEGLVARMSPLVRRQLNGHYAQVDLLNQMSRVHDADFLGMTDLGLPLPLDASTRFQIIQELQEMRDRAEWHDTLSGQLVDHIQKLGMVPPPDRAPQLTERFGTYKYCKAHGLPLRSFDEAMRAIPN